ncbi:hypothetical protein T492DRAFT_1014703 [Pavlovales sp. CCMP2436]|nr:hypothetical protein T492DRAFT_1014703 [Pavlovales sp. CCMP2436]|mmetsp:Transcript_21265/g.53921  ORF Transcript_21265/g.53921 Transcript_21265/m.53921 type:complete len:286 (+) Transcript_21265:169-1026(+)
MAAFAALALLCAGGVRVDSPSPLRLLELTLRPRPPSIARSRIDQDFAVLLMRTSYSVAEEMRFVAMDGFQRSFFLRRQDEWQPYLAVLADEVGSVPTQGDLTAAAYFDFISFAQYVTLADEMRKGQLDYVELVGAEAEATVRRRPPDVPRENALLPAEYRKRVGDAVLGWAAERYDVVPARSLVGIVSGSRALLEVFRIRGFVAATEVQLKENRDGTASLTCTITAPATLWSQQVFSQPFPRATLTNDFEAMVVASYLRDCGAVGIAQQTRSSSTDVRHILTFRL